MNRTTLSILASAVLLAGSTAALAGPLSAGNLMIFRVGNGTAALSGNGNPVFLDEYTPAGNLVQSITTGVFASATSTTDNFLSMSADGRYVMFTGYATSGSSGIATISATQNNTRVVGRLGRDGTVQLTPLEGDKSANAYFSGNTLRGAVSLDGSQFWTAGASSGVRYGTWGSGTTSAVYAPGAGPTAIFPALPGNVTTAAATQNNIRSLRIAGGQIIATAQMPAFVGTVTTPATRVFNVGSGTPTGTVSSVSNLPGFPLTSGTPAGASSTSPWGIVALDIGSPEGIDTMYIADSGAGTTGNAAGLGIQKWSLVGSTWTYRGTIAAADTTNSITIQTTVSVQLTASVGPSGVQLFATNGAAPGGTAGRILYSFLDTTGYDGTVSGSASLLVNRPITDLQVWRGIVVIPEPSVLGLLAPAGAMLLRRRR